jgi:hypothetical protein
MKFLSFILPLAFVILTGFKSNYQGENIEFSCLKTHKASNTCHFNFRVDGAKYRFVDMGCKYNNKVQEVIKKVRAGTLALAKDWKIDCPEVKGK